MCKDVYKASVWTLLVLSSLLSVYQLYAMFPLLSTAPNPLLYLGYVGFAMPVLALISYVLKKKWLAAVFAAAGVCLSGSVALATFLVLVVLGEVSGKG